MLSLIGEYARSNEAGHFLHQLEVSQSEGTPCFYGLSKDERQTFIEKLQSCNQTNHKLIPNAPFKEIYQEILFTMARDRFNEKNYCLERLLTILRERKSGQQQRIHDQWIDEIASSYALYLVQNAEAHRTYYQAKREYDLKIQALEKSNDPDKKQKRNDLRSNYQFEITSFNSKKKFANSFISNLPFLSHEQSEDFIKNVSKKLYSQLGEQYRFQPDAITFSKNELEEKIKKILNEISDKYFEKITKSISSEIYISKERNLTDNERTTLWDRGFVLDVLDELFEDQPKLKEKLKNCVEGSYGTYSKGLNFIYDFGLGVAFARLFYSSNYAKYLDSRKSYDNFFRLFRLPPAGKDLMTSPIMRNPFNFALNSSGFVFIKKQFEIAYDMCIKKTPRYAAIQVPKNCENEKDLETFSLDSLGLSSCMTEIRRTLLF